MATRKLPAPLDDLGQASELWCQAPGITYSMIEQQNALRIAMCSTFASPG